MENLIPLILCSLKSEKVGTINQQIMQFISKSNFGHGPVLFYRKLQVIHDM